MLKIQVREIEEAKCWAAKATLSGRGVSAAAGDWCYAGTKKQALKTLRTRLKRELKIITAAHYRVGACLEMTSQAIDSLNPKGE